MNEKTKKKPVVDLLKAKDLEDIFNGFKNDKERIKYMSHAYRKMSLAKAFSHFYDEQLSDETMFDKSINSVVVIEVGKIYLGTVKSLTNGNIVLEIPGVKDDLIVKDNFNDCIDVIQSYLLTHNNKVWFDVIERVNGKYHVSIIQGMYKKWMEDVNKCITREDGINVHIDNLVGGGYVGNTVITNLNQLTGKNYTCSVFIPGSHIVLNIEHDFERWIGEDVVIVPQKFGEFWNPDGTTQLSLVGSRKRVLQIMGMNNMYDIYNRHKLTLSEDVKVKPEVFDGTVTGIINSNNKTGIFIELNDKYITGLMNIDASDLLDYKPGDPIKVSIKEFETQEGRDPFMFNKKGRLVRCNVRPVFVKA